MVILIVIAGALVVVDAHRALWLGTLVFPSCHRPLPGNVASLEAEPL